MAESGIPSRLGTPLDLVGPDKLSFWNIMIDSTATDSLGARIISAAQLAVAVHAEIDAKESLPNAQKAQAMVGGADRRVTDDQSSLSVASGPSSVVH